MVVSHVEALLEVLEGGGAVRTPLSHGCGLLTQSLEPKVKAASHVDGVSEHEDPPTGAAAAAAAAAGAGAGAVTAGAAAPAPAGDGAAAAAAASDAPMLSSFDLGGIAEYMKSGRASNIVVMVGAGISVAAGIPDFRTPGSGLYCQLQKYNLPFPEAVFSLKFFRENPKPFYLLAKELYPGSYQPTVTHHFLRLLHEKGLLLRVFTQNIDGLEQQAGLPGDKVVPAHGSFDAAYCASCGAPASTYALQEAVFDDTLLPCSRSGCSGHVKPAIVFFGEPLPARFHRRRLVDLEQADLLLVMGTSLVVQPFAGMIDAVAATIPRVLINREKVGEHGAAGDSDAGGAASPKTASSSSSSRNSSSSSSAPTPPPSPSGSPRAAAAAAGGSAAGAQAFAETMAEAVAAAEPGTGEASLDEPMPTAAAAAAVALERNGFSFGDCGAHARDVLHLGDCDEAVLQLAKLLGWEQDLQQLIQEHQAAATPEEDGEGP